MLSLVVGASGGIGSALVAALQGRGEVVGLSRSGDGLDVTDEASVARVLGRLEGPFDLVIVATGALVLGGVGPEKTLRAVTAEALAAQFAVNAIGPALVMKHALRLLPGTRQQARRVHSARPSPPASPSERHGAGSTCRTSTAMATAAGSGARSSHG